MRATCLLCVASRRSPNFGNAILEFRKVGVSPPESIVKDAVVDSMSTIVEKIKDIEKEISRTQINKATMSHLCSLRAKLAKYRTELLAPPKAGSQEGAGFEVERVGDARVALIGFPSVGKSTILSTFTTCRRPTLHCRLAWRDLLHDLHAPP